LGLRNPDYFNIAFLGLKHINLARNSLGDKFAETLAKALSIDVYIKCISLKHNSIGTQGFKIFASLASEHPSLLSINMLNNPGYRKSQE